MNCTNCGKEIFKGIKKGQVNYFCNRVCEKQYKHNIAYEKRQCPICLKYFETYKISNQVYCSDSCQIEWQRRYPRTGENHPNYIHGVDRNIVCEWCQKIFQPRYDRKRNKTVRFCSRKCRQEWYAKVWSQSPEWKESKRQWAIKTMQEKDSSKRSDIQKIVDSLLESIKIQFKNEIKFGDFLVDNYLPEYNLAIENMGTFWHADPRKYPLIKYSRQVNRIRMDKIKKTVMKNYGIDLLYLWEKDIKENSALCEKLIKLYIANRGKLNEYNSMNYILLNDNLTLKDAIIIPYLNWDIDELSKIIDTTTKEKMSHKEIDKWTTFLCEYCGEEKEELTCHYLKSEKHFCSMKCFNEYRKENKDIWYRKTPFLSNKK